MSGRRPKYRGVVFDLDGTLVDTMGSVLEGLAAAVEPFRPRPGRAEVLRSLGGPSDECLLRLLGGRTHLTAALRTYRRSQAAAERSLALFRGARTLLRELRAAGYPLGLWTGRERHMTEDRLRALALARQFDLVVCGDDLPSHKPDPEGLLRIVQRWDLHPSRVLFVGDSAQDFAGAQAAGVPLVAIDHDGVIAPARRQHPVAVVATPAAAFAWVRGALLAAGWQPARTVPAAGAQVT
ncbi:MAG TPA: HAD-IA family hydrolase [Opitutaceae bacterium]|nr:HAD-IA family hydrolase [Opitutaceae bacterium]